MSQQNVMLRNHAILVEPFGGSATVTVAASGGTVYYRDTRPVSSTDNQGSISPGSSRSFTSNTWITSAGVTTSVLIATTSIYDEWALIDPATISPGGGSITKAAVVGTGVTASDIGGDPAGAAAAAAAASVPVTALGAVNGVATLDATQNVPVQYLTNALANIPDTADAVRLQSDRFYYEAATGLSYTGTQFVAEEDAYTRPQNVDLVTCDSTKVRITHALLAPSKIVGAPQVSVGGNMDSVGIRAVAVPTSDLTYTDIFFKQSRLLSDKATCNGTTFTLDKSPSPFLVSWDATNHWLAVTHDNLNSTHDSEVTLAGYGVLRPVVVAGGTTATGFKVAFYDNTGTLVTALSTNMVVTLTREIRDVPVNPTALSVPTQIPPSGTWTATVTADAPVSWMRLDDTPGPAVADLMGVNSGLASAGVTFSQTGALTGSGDNDNAILLNGSQGKVAFGSPGFATGPYSICLWFKNTGLSTVGATTYATLVGCSATKRLLVNATTGAVLSQFAGTQAITANGVAPVGQWNFVAYTFDGTTQRITVNGVQCFEGVTGGAAFNVPFWLGSYLTTSTNYSFKGTMDELLIFNRQLSLNELQVLYVNGSGVTLTTDRATDSKVGFRCLFETIAPPPAPIVNPTPPSISALPDGDIGGAASSYISLAPYRAAGNLDFGPSSPWAHRKLPATQAARDAIALNGLSGLPNATSNNWRLHACSMFGIDPTTGAVVTATQGGSTPLFMRTAGEHIYVVGDDEPLRTVTDFDTSVNGWATQFNNVVASLGGIPIPADALPHFTTDRYAFVYHPPHTWWTFYKFKGQIADWPAVTLSLTGSPSNGGFLMEFDYIDYVAQSLQTFVLPTPVPYNVSAAGLVNLLGSARTSSGTVLGTSRNGSTTVVASGGPLNVAPVLLTFPLVAPGYPVPIRVTNSFLNSGDVGITYGQNAQPWTSGQLCAVTSDAAAVESASGNHHHVPFANFGVASNEGGTAAATGIDWMPMIIDWDEYNTAYNIGLANGWSAAGTDLGHVVAMSIGDCGTGAVYPALPNRGDGTQTNTDGSKIKEGAFMTFPLTADSSKVAPEMMPLFNTIQRYGVVPIDKTGGGAEIIFRNWAWPGQSRPFPGPSTFNRSSVNLIAYMRQLPWHQLQFIDPAQVQAGW